MEQTVIEPRIRVNFKQNFKGDLGWEFTVRGDTIKEVEEMITETKEMIKRTERGA